MQRQLLKGPTFTATKYLWLWQATLSCPMCHPDPGKSQYSYFENSLENVVNRHEILRTTFCLPGMDIPVKLLMAVYCGFLIIIWAVGTWQQENKIAEILMKWASCLRLWERATFVSLVTLSPWKYLLIVSLPAMIADTAALKIWWMKSVVLTPPVRHTRN